jgi:AraC family transcriptional regulator of adaptative response/methylated-DNA-[protein]-cysteine methyltransferase
MIYWPLWADDLSLPVPNGADRLFFIHYNENTGEWRTANVGKLPFRKTDYSQVIQALACLETNTKADLTDLALASDMTPDQFDELFLRWAGVKAAFFFQVLQRSELTRMLGYAKPFTKSAAGAWAKNSGVEIVLLGGKKEKESQGKDRQIRYGLHDSPYGACFLAADEDGSIYYLGFGRENAAIRSLPTLCATWPKADIGEDTAFAASIIRRIFKAEATGKPGRFPLLVRGTTFQYAVWQALMHIPSGSIVSYADVARAAGRPRAVRAAASAVANNPVSYLIPCHRVIAGSGHVHRYGGGHLRKQAMLGREISRLQEARLPGKREPVTCVRTP